MELSVYNIKGEDTGRKVSLDESIFGIEPNEHVMYLAVRQYMAGQRQGTHKSKERSEISGSTRKLGRQKGGGGARRGDINSPLLVGGARVFGPTPRDYSFKLNKKTKRLARLSALSTKAKENKIVVVENLNFDAPKTKNYAAMIDGLNASKKNSLLVLSEPNKNVYLSAKNIPNADVILSSELNTYRIMRAACLLLTEDALTNIEKNLKA